MAGDQTKVSQSDIENVAKDHEGKIDDVEQVIAKLRQELTTVAASSSSQMTKALIESYEQDAEALKRSVISDLREMAGEMRGVAGDQTEQDRSNAEPIRSTALDSFL